VQAELLYRADLQVLAGDVCSAVDLHVIRPGGLPGADQGVVDSLTRQQTHSIADEPDGHRHLGPALGLQLAGGRSTACELAGSRSIACGLAKGCSRRDYGKESDNTKDRLLLHPAVARQRGQRGLPQPDDQADDQYGGDAG
jgi:hypothetical protein